LSGTGEEKNKREKRKKEGRKTAHKRYYTGGVIISSETSFIL
jgi:hypothetical protein